MRFDVAALELRWSADEAGSFPCPIPGHRGTARIIEQDGELRLACSCTGRWRSLGEARLCEGYGRDVFHPSNIEIATWARRLACETDTFEPLDVLVPALPDEASSAARRARIGFMLLVGLRWRDGEHRPVAYAVRFCAAWTDLSFEGARVGIRELIEHGVIHEAGRAGGGGLVRLYLPGGEP